VVQEKLSIGRFWNDLAKVNGERKRESAPGGQMNSKNAGKSPDSLDVHMFKCSK